MSTVDTDVEVPGGPADTAGPATAGTAGAATPGTELTSARLARVGDIEVHRLLPLRHRRSVGAWCIVDHYGPAVG